ncbi:helix-turn-helix domain-containing protein [Taibaiella lutea]|nr:helix-turn-helix domain-containing protein [Taibaiella lutea]
MQNTDTSNIIFQQAVAFVNQTNQHLFLTGKAGTGKTTFLKYIRNHCYKKMAVVAPTGVAAINAGGVTIHSFFQLPFGTFLPSQKTVWGGEFNNIYNKNQLLSRLKLNKAKRDLMKELDLLIIDEVSMVRADVMDAMDVILRSVRRNQEQPFGGLQVLFIGDMFQLPPVVRDSEMELLSEFYQSPFFFDSLAVKEAMPIYLELKKIYRQSDTEFINILNNVRNNDVTEEDLERLQQNFNPYFNPMSGDSYITLTTHNAKADTINQHALDGLPGKIHKLEAKISGEFPENAYPIDKVLHIKEGAQIMFIKNDKGENRRFYNGKIGIIDRIDEYDKKVFVSFPDEDNKLELELETWSNIRYQFDNEKDEIKEEELGTFAQYPIRLAWAVTIHKSQGLTFEKAIVDAGQSFAPGQVYVALSRLTNLDGLVLKSKITPASIMTDERILKFSEQEESEDTIQRVLEDAQGIFAEQSLIQAYQWEKLTDAGQDNLEAFVSRSIPDQDAAYVMFMEMQQSLLEQQNTALKFKKVLNEFIMKGKSAYPDMHLKTMGAAGWFNQQLDEKVIQKLKKHIEEVKVKPRTKKYVKEIREFLLLLERKKIQIQQTVAITEGLALSLNREQLMERVSKLHTPIEIKPEEEKLPKTKASVGETKLISLKMFQEGKTIDEIATERSLVRGTVEGHLVEFIVTGEVDVYALVPKHKLDVILKAVKENPDATSGAIRLQIGEQYTFAEIKGAMAFYKKEQNKN